jgi:hypothetical protein
MKADKNYRMSKQLKTVLASMPIGSNRNEVKRLMIDAELSALKFRTSRRPAIRDTGASNGS